ncbi:MAG: hypothetical protein OEW32_17995 [Nitrospira sp.]|nr:hypothetical protein [Nitrospira sp.]
MRTSVKPWTYPWSSHAAYLGRTSPIRVETSTVLESFHRQVGPARQAYRRFMLAGLSQGHQKRFYETVDQAVLGDERFLYSIAKRRGSIHTRTPRSPRVGFGPLLKAVAAVHRITPRAILEPGRQRALVPARAMLVFLAREWSRLTTSDLGKRLQRDPSMVSRLAGAYAAQRDAAGEAQVRRLLGSDLGT